MSTVRDDDCLRLVIGGDVAPPQHAFPLLARGQLEEIAPDHQELLRSAHGVVANLEAPFQRGGRASAKSGPSLFLPPALTACLKALRLTAVGLANNHIMDLGAPGLADTRSLLQDAGILHVGAGINLDEAGRALVLHLAGRKIGILAAGAHEFGVARDDRPGMNPLDPVRLVPALLALRPRCDLCVVLLHAGNEGHPWPSPWLQAYCRLLAELGADLVACQHSHIIGCQERHGRGHIVYGQGNFLMDLDGRTPDHYREGLLLEVVTRTAGAPIEVHPHPIRLRPDGSIARLDPAREERLLAEFQRRSDELTDPAAVAAAWRDHCGRHAATYRAQLHFANRFLIRACKVLGLGRVLVNPGRRLLLQNLIRCQDHREALLTILEEDL